LFPKHLSGNSLSKKAGSKEPGSIADSGPISTATASRFGVSVPSATISTPSPTGWSRWMSRRWRWQPPGCIGSLCTRCSML